MTAEMPTWIKVARGWRDHEIFSGPYSAGEAWLWLIENAAWQETKTRIKGQTVTLQRGQLSFSVRFMADKWGWSKSRVDRFLSTLKNEGMIQTCSKIGTAAERKAGQGQSIITVCNYARFQDSGRVERDNSGTGAGTTAGQQRDKEEEYKKERIDSLASGAREPANDLPTDAAGEVLRTVMKAAGMATYPDDMELARTWLRNGISPEKDIYPTVNRVMTRYRSRGDDRPIKALSYFDKAIREAHQLRQKKDQDEMDEYAAIRRRHEAMVAEGRA